MRIAGRSLEVVQTPALRDGAPTVVFLHEGLGSVALWRDVPQRIGRATGFGTLVYSRYGNGFSDVLDAPRRVEYMHDEALVVLPELLEACGVRNPALFGHSDGASIALIFAGAFPNEVAALVVEAPHAIVEDISVESIAQIRVAYSTTTLPEKMARYHADVDATFFGWNDIWLAPEFRSWSIVERLSALRAPALAIQGTDDEYGTLEQLELLRRASPARTDVVQLAGCGHAPHRDRRSMVEALATTWLLEALLPD